LRPQSGQRVRPAVSNSVPQPGHVVRSCEKSAVQDAADAGFFKPNSRASYSANN